MSLHRLHVRLPARLPTPCRRPGRRQERCCCCRNAIHNFSGAEHVHGQIGSIGYCSPDAAEENRLVKAMLRASFSPSRVAVADTYTAVEQFCGPHYRDCSASPQTDSTGRKYVCQVHFTRESFGELHGPAVARALAQVALQPAPEHKALRAAAAELNPMIH